MKTFSGYDERIHRVGRWTTAIAVFLMLCVPLGVTLAYGIHLDISKMFSALVPIAVIFIPSLFIEVVATAPLLGVGGTYLAFVTGNIIQLKLPAVTSAQNALGVKPYTDEGEVVSVLAVGASSLVCTAVVSGGVFFLAPLIHYLEHPAIKPAFVNMMPALVGALLFPSLRKYPKIGVVSAFFAVGVCFFLSPTGKYGQWIGYLMLANMIIALTTVFLSQRERKTAVLGVEEMQQQ